MWLAFVLLALAICATWVSPLPAGARRVAPWLPLFVAAVATGWAVNLLHWQAVAVLILLTWCAYRTGLDHASSLQRWLFGMATVVLTLGLATHRFPGFANPVLIANAVFTPDAAPFTQYANFDKGAAGAILLACLCRRSRTWQEWRLTITATLVIALATIAVVIGLALLSGHVRVAPKWPAYTPIFLLVNLLFTCVAEEAYFRGLVQDWLARFLAPRLAGPSIAAILSAIVFGLAHVGGGAGMASLATLAGAGYAFAYARTGRIEAPVMVHFALNAVHFTGFTYPYIQ